MAAINIIPTTDWKNIPGCLSGPNNDIATLACIPGVIQNVISFLVLFAGAVCVFLIIVAGYKFVMSEGDPEKIASARKTLTYAIGGFLFVTLSFVILNIIASFTGAPLLAPK